MSIKSTLGLVVALAAGAAATGVAQSISGQAFGVFVNTPAASQAQAPLAVLPAISGTDGDIAHADADVLGVPNTLSSSFLNSTATGAIGTAESSAQSVATVARAASRASPTAPPSRPWWSPARRLRRGTSRWLPTLASSCQRSAMSC